MTRTAPRRTATAFRRAATASAAATAGTALARAGSLSAAGAAGDRPGGEPAGPEPVEVQLLALNDFHGNLEPPSGSGGRIQSGVDAQGQPVTVDAGGAEYLATQLAMDRHRGQPKRPEM